jgi:hypothetical protein
MTAAATAPSTAGHGLLRSFPPLPSTASLPPDRRGRLKNGAKPGDFLAAPRCGAQTRCGNSCRQPAMANGRCRMHGGLSTGPRTAEGRERCRRARLTHGFYSVEMVALRRAGAAYCRRMDALLDALKVRRTAGHGVLPSEIRSQKSEAGSARARARPSTARRRGLPPSGFCVLASRASAGHGLHPSFSHAPLSPRARRLLAGVAPLAPFSAGHGVLRSFSSAGAIVPAGTP